MLFGFITFFSLEMLIVSNVRRYPSYMHAVRDILGPRAAWLVLVAQQMGLLLGGMCWHTLEGTHMAVPTNTPLPHSTFVCYCMWTSIGEHCPSLHTRASRFFMVKHMGVYAVCSPPTPADCACTHPCQIVACVCIGCSGCGDVCDCHRGLRYSEWYV